MRDKVHVDGIGVSLLLCVVAFILALGAIQMKVSAMGDTTAGRTSKSAANTQESKPQPSDFSTELFGYAVMETGSKVPIDRLHSSETPSRTCLHQLQCDIAEASLIEKFLDPAAEVQVVSARISTTSALPGSINFN